MESFAADRATMVRTPIEAPHVKAMHKVGTVSNLAKGDTGQEPGRKIDESYFV